MKKVCIEKKTTFVAPVGHIRRQNHDNCAYKYISSSPMCFKGSFKH